MKTPKFIQHVCAFFSFPFFYRKIRKARVKDEALIVLAPKFGDTVYGMIYVNEFKKETNKKIAVYCSDSDVKFLKSYGCIDRFITHPKNIYYQSKIFLAIFFKFFFDRKCKNKDIIYTAPPQYLFHNRNALDIYKNTIFSLKKDSKQLLNLNEKKITSIQNFDEIKDRIIIFNSFSNSHKSKCTNLMQQAADLLMKKGFIIYCNVVGDQKPLKNTFALNCPVDELFSICNAVRGFVTIRSGVADFVAGTSCEKVVLYMEKNFLKICSIASLNDNIHEFEVLSKEDQSQFLKFINKTF